MQAPGNLSEPQPLRRQCVQVQPLLALLGLCQVTQSDFAKVSTGSSGVPLPLDGSADRTQHQVPSNKQIVQGLLWQTDADTKLKDVGVATRTYARHGMANGME